MAEQTKYFSKTGHLNDEGVALYADALTLDRVARLPDLMLRHVEECQECKQDVLNLYDLIRTQDYAELGPHPSLKLEQSQVRKGKFFQASRFRSVLRIAAMFILFLGAGWVFYSIWTDRSEQVAVNFPEERKTDQMQVPDEQEKTETKMDVPLEDSAKQVPEEKLQLLAANFVESPNMEDLLNTVYRSGGVKVLSPQNSSDAGKIIEFRWQTQLTGNFYVKILNNLEDVVTTLETTENQINFNQNLQPGLYYWKLETEDELLYVGKFFVRE